MGHDLNLSRQESVSWTIGGLIIWSNDLLIRPRPAMVSRTLNTQPDALWNVWRDAPYSMPRLVLSSIAS